ncbi:endoplasmic reticulum-Golgi intermediate compartment protein 3 [Trichonephila inaurata madagascariensis]|uniref:Endoplasmic reticulum-Golgi intermediate compartment protein 3 n=1 Tax=Trichonephila inaurata madagascariensis TaxID=2747483 RepID=A0A8X7CQZ5_9ARAC|nr:endoplasmic reticulum-Golgi intermediate compartment protein 3 [Trichonephila inaurata madagascariensis]
MLLERNKLSEHIRKFDAYPKTLEDFRVKTFAGAAVTIVSAVIITLLFISELNYYLTSEVTEELFVDVSRSEKLRINIDVTFPNVMCDVGSSEVMNVTIPPTLDPNRCESCYGAEIPPRNCCNTCEEVQDAYRMKGWAVPDVNTFEQCKREGWIKKIESVDKEGCQIFGYLDVNRVAGNFHIAPGKTFTQHHVHVIKSGVSLYASDFNLTHIIRHLSFGRSIPGKTNPLDGTMQVAQVGAMMFQYYVKIVPSMYARADGQTLHTNQFAVTRHQKQVSTLFGDQGLPGLFVIYELAPLMIKYGEKEKSFFHFLTSVCAIVGGVFTVAGMIDSAIYHSSKVIQKIELGKVS